MVRGWIRTKSKNSEIFFLSYSDQGPTLVQRRRLNSKLLFWRDTLNQIYHLLIIHYWYIVAQTVSGHPFYNGVKVKVELKYFMFLYLFLIFRCSTPLRLRGRPLSELHYDAFRCGDEFTLSFRHIAAIALIMLITFLFVTGLVIFVYKCRHKVI